jgi:hypothetical protein
MKVGITNSLPAAEFVFMCAPVEQELAKFEIVMWIGNLRISHTIYVLCQILVSSGN